MASFRLTRLDISLIVFGEDELQKIHCYIVIIRGCFHFEKQIYLSVQDK